MYRITCAKQYLHNGQYVRTTIDSMYTMDSMYRMDKYVNNCMYKTGESTQWKVSTD